MSARQQAAEEAAFVHRVAGQVFELATTKEIVETWELYAREKRAAAKGDPAVERELVFTFIAILDESKRMAARHVADAATRLAESLRDLSRDLVEVDLGSQDQLDNFETQRLMSEYNQAVTLFTSVQHKLDCTISSVISKIG